MLSFVLMVMIQHFRNASSTLGNAFTRDPCTALSQEKNSCFGILQLDAF